MKVALSTEGTYPFSKGGVSTWCDQVIRSMPGTEFELHAVTGTSAVSLAQPLPSNVVKVTTVPLWDREPRRSRPRRAVVAAFLESWEQLIRAAVLEAPAADHVAAWKSLAAPGVGRVATELVALPEAADIVLNVYREAERVNGQKHHASPSTLAEVVSALELFRRQLLPLAQPAADVGMTHATGNGLPVLPSLSALWQNGTPFLLSEHGVYLRERILALRATELSAGSRALLVVLLLSLVTVGYAEASVIAPGNLYNRRWEERLGADASSIVTAYNGVDPAEFPVAAREPATPTLVSVGRIDPLKDIDTMIRAFAGVRRVMPDAQLRLFGPVPDCNKQYAADCAALAVDLGVDDAVTFEGMVNPVWDGYHAGHVTMLSSISEGFPYSVLESLACGRPVVATDVGGVPEAVGNAGLIVPARDPQAMAKACIDLLSNDEKRAAMSLRGRERVLSEFTLEKASLTMQMLYDRTLLDNSMSAVTTTAPVRVKPSLIDLRDSSRIGAVA